MKNSYYIIIDKTSNMNDCVSVHESKLNAKL